MSESKTGRKAAQAAAAMNTKEKKIITDEQYVKNLRNDVGSGLHVTQEGAKALLRQYDNAVAELTVAVRNHSVLEEKFKQAVFDNVALQEKLGSALMEIDRLNAEKKNNAEIAATAPFADQLESKTTVDSLNASRERTRALTQKYDDARATESGLEPANQGKDSIGQ